MGAYEQLLDELADEARRRPDRHLFGYGNVRQPYHADTDARPDRVRAAAADRQADMAKSLSQLEQLVSALPPPRPPTATLTSGERIAAARMLREQVMTKALTMFAAGQVTGHQVAELEQLANAGVARFERIAR